MTNIYTTRNKSELESFSQNKTIFFQELLARLFSQCVSPLQYLDLGVSLKITHYNRCMCAQSKVVNITNVIRGKKIDMSSPRSLEAIRR